MYHKLARGHASQFIARLPDFSSIGAWSTSPRCRRAAEVFLQCSLSKKPGWTLARLAPHLKPLFSSVNIIQWSKTRKAILADAITAAKENGVFAIPGTEAPLYEERSVFLSNAFLTQEADRVAHHGVMIAVIGHHALVRMLERELTTPNRLHRRVRAILGSARSLAMTIEEAGLDQQLPYSFLVRYGPGALAIATMAVQASPGDIRPRREIMSVRTYLGPDMMTDDQRARMTACEEIYADQSSGRSEELMIAWISQNARERVARAQTSRRAARMRPVSRRVASLFLVRGPHKSARDRRSSRDLPRPLVPAVLQSPG